MFMPKPLFPKSVRKYIRAQKARIRRENSDSKRQDDLILALYDELKARYQKQTKQEQKTKVPKQELVEAAKGI